MLTPKCQCKQLLRFHPSKSLAVSIKCHLHCFNIFFVLKHIIQYCLLRVVKLIPTEMRFVITA